jgi:beta-glucosidase
MKRVSEVLRVKFRVSFFDSYVQDTKAADKIVLIKNKDFVLEIQKQSLVLLKNEQLTAIR